MRLRAATAADFGFVRGLAGRPDYAPFMTDEDEAALGTYLSDGDCRLLIWEDAAGPAGFALYAGLAAHGVIELRRLALARAGRGEGAAFLAAMVDYAFRELAADRLWLDASGLNDRAQKAYAKAGFTLEGRLRGHWYRPALGHVVDVLLYGMMRGEWQR